MSVISKILNKMLVGRDFESQQLAQLERSSKAEFVVVYGRRRIGKTYLIRQYYDDRLTLDFVGSDKESHQTQVANFNRVFADQCSTKYKEARNWSEAFDNLARYLRTLPKSKKAVVFFDEFPWLDKAQSGFLGAFEFFWNQHASKMKHLIFIACGSVASWIIKKLINNYGGLHNRVTLTLEIKPFSLYDTQHFFAYKKLRYTQYQILQLYMATGGVPYYLERIPAAASVAQAIDKMFFTSSATLGGEFTTLFASLFKNPEPYLKIIDVLSKHHYGLQRSEIIKKSKLAAGGTFNRTIETLEACGFVMKMPSIDKKNRDAVYRLIDMFCIFHSKFVNNNKSRKLGTWQSLANSSAYKTWCGYAFENVCLLHVSQIQQCLGIGGIACTVGAWRVLKNKATDGAQIDIVIERKDGITHLCEAKFTSKAFITSNTIKREWSNKRAIFEFHTKTKNAVVTSFIGTYQPLHNTYFSDEVHSSILMDDLFVA
ncbi:MAG: hypothetical protein RL660_1511 [Bacteroidota bacterium]